jgi:hypothetical protein
VFISERAGPFTTAGFARMPDRAVVEAEPLRPWGRQRVASFELDVQRKSYCRVIKAGEPFVMLQGLLMPREFKFALPLNDRVRALC